MYFVLCNTGMPLVWPTCSWIHDIGGQLEKSRTLNPNATEASSWHQSCKEGVLLSNNTSCMMGALIVSSNPRLNFSYREHNSLQEGIVLSNMVKLLAFTLSLYPPSGVFRPSWLAQLLLYSTSSILQLVSQDIHLVLHVRSSRQALVESVYIKGWIKALQGIAVNAIQLSTSLGTWTEIILRSK